MVTPRMRASSEARAVTMVPRGTAITEPRGAVLTAFTPRIFPVRAGRITPPA